MNTVAISYTNDLNVYLRNVLVEIVFFYEDNVLRATMYYTYIYVIKRYSETCMLMRNSIDMNKLVFRINCYIAYV